ncbi:MAG: hypothetical protein NTZ46_04970 [Verrucomicrobia bacterium]|nr:hypothetical protein [Verrucomicrobiota bacterium]
MNKFPLIALALLAFAPPCLAVPGVEYAIKKVEVQFPPSPDFGQNGTVRWTPQKWVKMEVTFDASPEFTEELAFTYYALTTENRLLVGRVNHVNITKGRDLHSVMYVSPKTVVKILQHKAASTGELPLAQVTVTISKPGVAAPIAIGNFKGAGRGDWWSTMKQEEGYLLNKTETPFAPLYWDYYESVKPAGAR